jgi:hypothetical protein
MSIHAVLPIVWAADRAPLRLEPPRDEILSWLYLVLLAEVGNEEFLARVGEGAETTARTALSLVAKTLAEEIWVVKQLGSAMARTTGIATRADALIVKLLVAWLCTIKALAFS